MAGPRFLSEEIRGEVVWRITQARLRFGRFETRGWAKRDWVCTLYVAAPFGGGKTYAGGALAIHTISEQIAELEDVCRAVLYMEPTRSTLIAAARRVLAEQTQLAREVWTRGRTIRTYLPMPETVIRQLGRTLILAGSDVSCLNQDIAKILKASADTIAVKVASRLWSHILKLLRTGLEKRLGEDRARPLAELASDILGISPDPERLYEEVRQAIEYVLSTAKSEGQDITTLLENLFTSNIQYTRELLTATLQSYMWIVRDVRKARTFMVMDYDPEALRELANCLVESSLEAEVMTSLAPYCSLCPLSNRDMCFRLVEYIFRRSPYLAITSARETLGTPEEKELLNMGVYATGKMLHDEASQLGIEACPYKAFLRLQIFEPAISEGKINIGLPAKALKYVMVLTHQIFFGSIRKLLEEYYRKVRTFGIAIPHMWIIDEADVIALTGVETLEIPHILATLGPTESLVKLREVMAHVGVDVSKTGPTILSRIVEKVADLAERLDKMIRSWQHEYETFGFVPHREASEVVREILSLLKGIHSEWITSARSGLRTFENAAAAHLLDNPQDAPLVYTWVSVARRCLELVEALKEIPDEVLQSPEFTYWLEMPRLHMVDYEAVTVRKDDRLNLMLATLPLLIIKRYDVAARILLDHTYPYPAQVRVYMSATISKSMLYTLFSSTLPPQYLDSISNPRKKPRNLTRLLDIEWIEFENPYEGVHIWCTYAWLDLATYRLFFELGRYIRARGFADQETVTRIYYALQKMQTIYGMKKSDFLASSPEQVTGQTGISLAQTLILNLLCELYTVYSLARELNMVPDLEGCFCFVIFGTSPQYETVIRDLETLLEAGPYRTGITPYTVTILGASPYEGRRDIYLVDAEVNNWPIKLLMTYARGREGRGVDIDVVARSLMGQNILICSYVLSQPLKEPTSIYAAEVQKMRSALVVEDTDAVVQMFQAAFRVVRAVSYRVPRFVLIDIMAWPNLQQVDKLPLYLRDMLKETVNEHYFTYTSLCLFTLMQSLGIPLPT